MGVLTAVCFVEGTMKSKQLHMRLSVTSPAAMTFFSNTSLGFLSFGL